MRKSLIAERPFGRRTRFAIVAFGLLLVACESGPMSPLPGDAVILAFGDSLTSGVGASSGEDYPRQLARLTGFRVVNGGVSGETAQQGRRRLPSELRRYNPDLVLLLMGGNDFLRSRQRQAVKSDLAAMVEAARARGSQVLLIGVPEKSLFLSTSPIYKELAEAYNVVLAEDIVADLLRSPRYKSDMIHLNDEGYSKLAQTLAQLLRRSGAL